MDLLSEIRSEILRKNRINVRINNKSVGVFVREEPIGSRKRIQYGDVL